MKTYITLTHMYLGSERQPRPNKSSSSSTSYIQPLALLLTFLPIGSSEVALPLTPGVVKSFDVL